MKSIFKRKILPIIVALAISVTAVLGGLTISAQSVRAATLPEMSDLTFSTDIGDKPLLKGNSFKLILTFSTKRTDTYWASIDIAVGPLNASKTDFDLDLAKKIDVATHYDEDYEDDVMSVDYGDINTKRYNVDATESHLHKDASADQHGYFRLGIYHEAGAPKPSTDTITVSIEFVVAEDIVVDSLTFGVVKMGNPTPSNGVAFGDDQVGDAPVASEGSQGILTTNEVEVNLITEEDDTFLESLSMGPAADNLTAIDLDKEPYGYTIDQAMDNLVVKPVTEVESATAQVGVSDGSDGYKPSGALTDGIITLPRPKHNDKVVVLVTSASGKEALYEVTITISYVRIEALTVSTGDDSTTGSTTLGLKEEFDKDTFAYTVNVPEDEANGAKAEITATVIQGYDASSTVALAGTGCTVDASVESAAAFTVTDIKKDVAASVTLTLTAADGTTTQDYVLTFATLSTDTSLTIQAVATTKTYDSDTEKATENSVDYYFFLTDETVFEAAFAITVADGATVKITDAESNETTYDDTTKDNKYPLGTYTVTVIASAGNSDEYKVVLAAPELIELALDSNYLFLFEQVDGNFKYRKAYIEYGYVHGVDDKDWECHIVLGAIPLKTTINTFLSNIKENLLPFLKIYNSNNLLYYDRGNVGSDFPAGVDFDSTIHNVGTGWRIELCPGETTLDVIYLSVLGDVTGEGVLSTQDTARVTKAIQGMSFTGTEYLLSAYVVNSGAVSTRDTAALTSIIAGKRVIDDYVNYVPLVAES